MSKKYYPTDLLKQAQSMRAAWAQIDSKLAFGELTTASLGLEIDQARTLTEEIDRIETALVDKRNQLDAHYATIHGSMKRILADAGPCEIVDIGQRPERIEPESGFKVHVCLFITSREP